MTRPRDTLSKPYEGYPAYGAAHAVIPNEQLRGFMYDASRICDFVIQHSLGGVKVDPIEFREGYHTDTFALAEGIAERVDDYDPRMFYRIFDSDTLGVTVVEMDASEKAARAVRTVWEGQDFGAVEQEVRDQLGEAALGRPSMVFGRVDTVGKRLPGTKYDVRQKLALFPDAHKAQATLELLEKEADELSNAIRRRLKQYMRPWDTTPHVTFALTRTATTAEDISVIVESMNNYLALHPFGIALDPISFRHKSVRGKAARR